MIILDTQNIQTSLIYHPSEIKRMRPLKYKKKNQVAKSFSFLWKKPYHVK
jgi:hypothetical protein